MSSANPRETGQNPGRLEIPQKIGLTGLALITIGLWTTILTKNSPEIQSLCKAIMIGGGLSYIGGAIGDKILHPKRFKGFPVN